MSLLLHPRTKLQLESFQSSPSHALIIMGSHGIGKSSVAKKLAEDILSIKNIETYAYASIIRSKEGKAISIEEIRGLDEFLSLKVPGQKSINRIVVIEDADKLTHEAQNALLKTLEEPPKGTIIILTASYAEGLLPTIRSRSQSIVLQKPSSADTKDYFEQENSVDSVKQAMAISGGLPGLMHAMLDEDDHPLMSAVDQAKRYLQSTQYERLVQSDILSKDRKLTEETLYIIQQMAHISLQSASGPAASKWQGILESSYEASKALNQNGQIKLVLTNLALAF